MAYNKNNRLRRIAEIQDITLDYKSKGCTQEWIYLKVIFPTYQISRSTFYLYLRTAAKLKLRKAEAK